MVDNTIALRLDSPKLESPLNRMARGMQMLAFKSQADTAQQASAKNAMLNQAFSAAVDPKTGAIDYGKAASFLAANGGGAYAPDVLTSGAAATTAATGAEKGKFDLKRSQIDASVRDIASYKTPADAIAHLKRSVDAGLVDSQTATSLAAEIPQDPAQFDGWKTTKVRSLLTAAQQLEQNITNRNMGNKGDIFATPKYAGGPEAGTVPGSEYAIAPKPGSGSNGQDEYGLSTEYATGPDGKIVLVQRSKSGNVKITPLQEGYTPAIPTRSIDLGTTVQTVQSAGGAPIATTPKDVQGEAYAKKLGDLEAAQVAAAGNSVGFGEVALKQIDGVLNDPNLSKGTGIMSMVNFIPGTGSKAFQAKVDQVTGGAFLQGIQRMQNTGAITEVEGAKATAALTRATTGLSELEFRKAMEEYRDIVRIGVEKARKLESRRTGLPAEQPAGTAAPAPAGAGRADPLGLFGEPQ